MDNTSETERKERFKDDMELRKRDYFYWHPPNGESLANVCLRVVSFSFFRFLVFFVNELTQSPGALVEYFPALVRKAACDCGVPR